MEDLTIGWHSQFAELGFDGLTANLRDRIEANSNLEIVGELEWPFDLRRESACPRLLRGRCELNREGGGKIESRRSRVPGWPLLENSRQSRSAA